MLFIKQRSVTKVRIGIFALNNYFKKKYYKDILIL